jgi:hypothetical protein
VSRVTRAALGSGIGLGVFLALAALSQLASTVSPADRAELRLAWRARVPLVEECRRLTEEELAELPVHMRREEVCEGRVASYRLRVTVDGRPVRRATLRGAGARGDRPLYVFESIPLRPGRYEVDIRFERSGARGELEAGGGDPAGERPDRRQDLSRVPDLLHLVETVELGPREVVLITYVPERRRLERFSGDGR